MRRALVGLLAVAALALGLGPHLTTYSAQNAGAVVDTRLGCIGLEWQGAPGLWAGDCDR